MILLQEFYPCILSDDLYTETPPGWDELIQELLENINIYIDSHEDEAFDILYVKEKFGALRFAVRHAPDKVNTMIMQAYEESKETCGACGSPGEMQTVKHYMLPLCESHHLQAVKG